MIDLRREKPFPLLHLRRVAGVNRSKTTLFRWARVGAVSRVTGDRVRLETIYQGNARCTSLEAYWRFMFRMNGTEIPEDLTNPFEELNTVTKRPPKSKPASKPMPSRPHMESKAEEKKEARRGKKC